MNYRKLIGTFQLIIGTLLYMCGCLIACHFIPTLWYFISVILIACGSTCNACGLDQIYKSFKNKNK